MLDSTREFIRTLDETDVKYTMLDPTKSGKDDMVVSFGGKNMESIRNRLVFDTDNEGVAIRVFNIVKIPDDKLAKMLITVNSLNYEYRFVKFCIDTDDNTVQAEADVSFRAGSVGPVCMELLLRVTKLCDDVYPTLMKAIWS